STLIIHILSYSILLSFTALSPSQLSTLSLHDALPICRIDRAQHWSRLRRALPGTLYHAGHHGGGDDNDGFATVTLVGLWEKEPADRKSTRLNSSHLGISYAVFCLKKKKNKSKYAIENI